LTIGLLVAASVICFAFGRELFGTAGSSTAATAWAVVRWPLGLALSAIAVTALLKWLPRRHQPQLSWLAFGAGVAVVLWAGTSLLLGLFFHVSSSFGQTYGPLAGTVALLFWCFLSGLSLLYGAATTAQLEAVRAGRRAPQDAEKAAHDRDLSPVGATR
jgi:uncharacterized BrkB/YihY/UPF0761 family membrane protein